jgi:tRNA (mo5U34)-methyltransferase
MQPVLTAEQIQQHIRELGPWFHNLDLAGFKTAPQHFLGDYPRVKWQRFANALPADRTARPSSILVAMADSTRLR